MTPKEAKQHIAQIRQEKFWLDDPNRQPSLNPLLGMLRRSLNEIATGIFEHAHHYIFELTQNADDNSYPANAEHFLKFVLLQDDPTGTPGSQGCLCVLNDETGFEKRHVESLCDICDSTKKGNRERYTGEKGLGFKSVFLISDRPHIVSNGYSFHFRRHDCDAGLGFIVPHWDGTGPAIAKGISTAILLPLRGGSCVEVARQLADIESECILFLRRLRRIELVAGKSGLNRVVQCSSDRGFFNLEADGNRSKYFVHRTEHSCAHIREDKRKGVGSTEVTVALPLTAPEATDGRVFAFLPTEARTGFPFLINADFLLPASRERILDKPEWNKQLVKFAAVAFVEAFDKLRGNLKFQTAAYRYIPTKTDLLPGASLFAPLVDFVQAQLKGEKCILTEGDDYVLPAEAHFAGPLSRNLLAEGPPRLATFRLVHPALEDYRKRLEPLGVQSLTIHQVLEICADADWLRDRKAEWWETLFDLLSRHDIGPETVALFPLLRCQDGVCRCPSETRVFVQADMRQTALSLPSDWPSAHIFDPRLQNHLLQKPAAWAWLSQVAGLQPFSVQAYITASLLDWMREQTGDRGAERLVQATCFIAANLPHLDESAHKTLREKMPWLLANKRVLLPEVRGNKELITPECIEGHAGWNWVFISDHDRQHFWVLSDAYIASQTATVRDSISKMMKSFGAIDHPDPAKRQHPNGQIDWDCPRWLRDLCLATPPQNLVRKVAALERWIGRFRIDFAKFLMASENDGDWPGNRGIDLSELGSALRNRPWLPTTKGFVPPTSAFVANPEIKEFMGDSVPYVEAKLSSEILCELGVHLRLSASALLDLLRQKRDSGEVDEGLFVRIYRRLHTMEFEADIFRTEPLVFLSQPTIRWMVTEKIFWKDAGDVFDDEFGYAELTYGKEELHGFFTEMLEINDEVSEEQLAEVWGKMSGGVLPPPDIVEKRLNKILPKLAAVIDPSEPPDWWVRVCRRVKVWTTARLFGNPKSVYAPDDSFAEGLFANSAPIAWAPKSHLSARLIRLLRDLGCQSLTENLRSRAKIPANVQSSGQSRFLTRATKELLVCWVCATEGWRKRRLHLEQLMTTVETAVTELHVEYSLEGIDVLPSTCEADAYWDNEDKHLYLRHGATEKAWQAATAKSLAKLLEYPSKQDEDTVYRLLGLEVADARREMADRKWELAPEQKHWFSKFFDGFAVVDVSVEALGPKTREARPAITQDKNVGKVLMGLSGTGESQKTDEDNSPDSSETAQTLGVAQTDSETLATPAWQASEEGENQAVENQQTNVEDREDHSNEGKPARALKPADSEAEFVHVVAHTRQRPTRDRRHTQAGEIAKQEEHAMASISQATKAELEERAVQVIRRQFERVAALREFRLLDVRKRNLGYDLFAAKTGHALRIEIKSHLGEAKSVFVTQKEWHQSRLRDGLSKDDRWELWNVENLAADAGKVCITRYRYLPEEARTRESGYWVDLTACHSESVQ